MSLLFPFWGQVPCRISPFYCLCCLHFFAFYFSLLHFCILSCSHCVCVEARSAHVPFPVFSSSRCMLCCRSLRRDYIILRVFCGPHLFRPPSSQSSVSFFWIVVLHFRVCLWIFTAVVAVGVANMIFSMACLVSTTQFLTFFFFKFLKLNVTYLATVHGRLCSQLECHWRH